MSSRKHINTISIISILALSATGTMGCLGFAGEGSQEDQVIPVGDHNDTQKLGNGYNSKQKKLMPATEVYVSSSPDGLLSGDDDGDGIDDSATLMGNTEAHFTVGVDLGRKAVADAITGGAGADLSFHGVNVSGSIQLANENSADEYTGTYSLFARIKPKKAVLLPQNQAVGEHPASELAGTSEGLQSTGLFGVWHDRFADSDPDRFLDKVGDEFINAIEYGSWLMVNMKFHYRNAEDKKNIGGRLSVDWIGKINVEGGADYSAIENAATVDITVSARQFGGDSARLVQVLPTDILSCRLDNPEPCFNLFEQAVSYMQSDYPNQFRNGDGSLNLSKFNPVRYFTARYDESGPGFAAKMTHSIDQLSFASRQAYRKFQYQLETAYQHKMRADYLTRERASDMSADQRAKVENIFEMASDNVDTLQDLSETCLSGEPHECHDLWSAGGHLRSYDEKLLEL